MDLNSLLNSVSTKRNGSVESQSKVTVLYQGDSSYQNNKRSRARPYHSDGPKRSRYHMPERSLDSISDPIPYDKKEEREFQDVMDDYREGMSDEQLNVFQMILKGYNVFFTGDAGTGKSHVLRKAVSALRDLLGSSKVYVTASTGIAACNIGGITIHSFAGMGLGRGDVNRILREIRQKEAAVDRWQTCEVLVIDEISMLDGALFDTLEYIARVIRNNDHPFGGIQVVLCGDFFQLPPVGLDEDGVKYCFEARWWRSVVEVGPRESSPKKAIVLKRVFRQKDESLQRLLHEVRFVSFETCLD
ncbi:hypothetical protein WA538_005903 [Blastocystis sp. DL]